MVETEKDFMSLEKRQLMVFIVVAFGFPFIAGLPLSFAYRLGLNTYPFPQRPDVLSGGGGDAGLPGYPSWTWG